MAEDLVDMLQATLNTTFAAGVAKHLGEPEATTRSAVYAAVPALVTGLLRQASTPSGAPELERLVTDPAIDADLTSDIAAWLDDGPKTASLLSQGSALLSWLFGGRTGSVGRSGSPDAQRRSGVVLALSERRNGDAGVAVRRYSCKRTRARR